MQATVVYARNPFDPAADRKIYPVRRRISLATAARRYHVDVNRPVVCCYNGEFYLRAEWAKTVVRDGGVVAFISVPRGRGGSNPIAMVLTLALMIVAPEVGIYFFGASTIGASITSAAIVVGGSMLINRLLPPPRQPTPQIQQALAAASPTYALSGQGNVARLNQAVPLAYGRNRLTPDLAAEPYWDFPSGNDQVLYQLFCLGIGRFSIEQIMIEDTTVVWVPTYGTFSGYVFPDLVFELVPPYGTVTLFPTGVVTSGEVAGQTASLNVPIGPFVVNGPGPANLINAIGIDSMMPKGSFYANDAGGLEAKTAYWRVEAQQIDDGGYPVAGWVVLGWESHTASTTTPQRFSHRYNVPTGRYRVQYIRADAEDTSSRAGHELVWAGLRGYVPGSQNYGNVTMLAMRARASNSLSSVSSRQIKVVCTRMLPIRVNGAWQAEQPTRSIAWAAADMCRAIYAGNRPDTEINWNELDALDLTWSLRADSFDGVFDQSTDFWEALGLILRAGRAKAFTYGSTIHFWRHQQQALPTQLLTMRNTLPGSFTRERVTIGPDEADSVEVEYWDQVAWAPAFITCALPGVTPANPAKVKLFGVTQNFQAWREGMYLAAMHRYSRLNMGVSTELEGQINVFGDLVAVSDIKLKRSVSGDIVSVSSPPGAGMPAGTVIELSEAVTFGQGQHYMGFRGPQGFPYGPVPVSPGIDGYHVILGLDIPTWAPYTGTDMERTQFAFGPVGKYWQLARVEAMRPRGNNVELSLVNEDDRVHTADNYWSPGSPTPGWDLPTIATLPVIAAGSLQVTLGGTAEAPTGEVSWAPAPGANHYLVEISTDALSWTRVAEPTGPPIRISLPAGGVWIRVAAVGAGTGPWVVTYVSVSGDIVGPLPPPAATGLIAYGMITGSLLTWDDPPTRSQLSGVQILRGTVYDPNAAQVIDTPNAGPAPIYFDATGTTGVGYWYFIRLVNKRGQVGATSNGSYAVTGRVTSSDTTFSDSGNQIANSDFANASLSNWAFGTFAGSAANCQFGVDINSSYSLAGGHTAYAYQGNSDPNTIMDLSSEHLACQPNLYVEASCWTGAIQCIVQVYVLWFNSDGYALSAQLIGTNSAEKYGGRMLGDYKESWAIVQAPAGTSSACLLLRKLGTIYGNVDSYGFYTHPMLAIAQSAAQTEHTPYTPGPTGTVRGDLIPNGEIVSRHIPDDTILARHILAWQITAGKIAANTLVAGDAVMTNAYVDTLKIKNQAVTIEVSSYTAAEHAVFYGPFAGLVWYWQQDQVASILSDGIGPIQVRANFQWKVDYLFNPSLYLLSTRVLRDGIEVYNRALESIEAKLATNTSGWVDIAFEFSDGVLAYGGHTYELQMGIWYNVGGNYGSVSSGNRIRTRQRYLYLKEGKR